MANAYIGLGVAKGAEQAAEFQRNRPMRELRLQEAKARAASSELQLAEMRAGAPVRQSQRDLELEANKQQLRTLQAQQAREVTFQGFKQYNADPNVKHLNNALKALKTNPVSGKAYQNVTRLDEVTRTAQSEQLLRQAGIQDIDGFFSTPEIKQGYVLATGADGNQSLVNLDRMYAATGYTQYATQQELETMANRARTEQLAKYGVTYGEMSSLERTARSIQQETGMTYAEALKFVQGSQQRHGSSMIERTADMLQEQDTSLSRVDALQKATEILKPGAGTELEREAKRIQKESGGSYEDALAKAKINLQKKTTSEKELGAADSVRTQLEEANFWNLDLADSKVRRQIGPKIAALEKLTDKSLTTEDKRVARNMRELIELGDIAGEELSPQHTGILDNMLNKFKKYVSDNVEVTKGTAAYETFRNSIRHALYGATLSQGEIAAFNSAAGTLGQQAGPVLQQLVTQLHTVKSQLKSIYDMNEPMIAEYYVGSNLEDIDRVIEQIDARINMISRPTDRPTIKDVRQTMENKSLDEIFQGL